MSNIRLEREKRHGAWIAERGEGVWNWSTPAGRVRWARRVAMFRDFLAACGPRVLEVGCGTGLFTAELAATASHITAIDISPDLLDLARQRVTAENVVFALENAYETTFASESFDAVVGSSCFHHLDIDQALRELFRLLKPGGRMMFTEPNMLNPQIFLQKNIPPFKKLAGDSPDETAFVRFSLAPVLERAGYEQISIIPFDFVHPFVPKLLLGWAVPLLNAMEQVPLVREIAGSLIITAHRPHCTTTEHVCPHKTP